MALLKLSSWLLLSVTCHMPSRPLCCPSLSGHASPPAQVERQLRRADNLSAHAECVMERRRHVVHTQQRACSICFRRIGNTVVVVYPDHSVAHYLCHSNLQGGA